MKGKTLLTTQSEYLQVDIEQKQIVLYVQIYINSKELAQLKQNKSSLVKLST